MGAARKWAEWRGLLLPTTWGIRACALLIAPLTPGGMPPLAAALLLLLQETQTKAEGQIHFFPIIMDGSQLYKVMSERCGPSQNSGPK